MLNKGISPLIATVLLIAFTVGVAGIISTWLTGFTQQSTKQVGEQSNIEVTCSYGGISLSSLRYGSNTMAGNIENTGSISLGNITLQIIYSNKTVDKYTLCLVSAVGNNCTTANISIGARELITFNVSTSSTYDKIRVYTNCSKVYATATSSDVTT